MRPFALLIRLPGRVATQGKTLDAVRKLLPAQGTELLMAWEDGAVIGFAAEAPPADYQLRQALGERAGFVVLELAAGGQMVADGFGPGLRWLRQHCAPPR